MVISERSVEGITVVDLSGRLDSQTSPELDGRLQSLIAGGARKLVVNFEHLEYISSAGLRVLLSAAKHLRGAEGEIRVCCLNEVVQEVFHISGFSELFKTFPSEAAALERF